MILLLLLATVNYLINFYKCQEIDLNVNVTQVFVHKISPDALSWNKNEHDNDFRYTVTSMDGPDVPPWLYVKHIKKNNNLYIFGAAPKDLNMEILELQISVTNLYNYRTKYMKLKIWFNFIEEFAGNEIRFHINNLDIEEMLNKSRQYSLIEIFEEHFWKASKGKLYLTFLAASDDEGYLLPTNPNDTSGVVVHLGSTTNFSEELFNLQNETIPLAKHCPTLSKRITVERFFRPKNFIIDWCSFKLVKLNECFESLSLHDCNTSINNSEDKKLIHYDEKFLTSKDDLPWLEIHGFLTLFIVIPSAFFALMVTWFSSFLCVNTKTLNDPYSDDYFETIFFICEDCVRQRRDLKDITTEEGEPENETFHF